MISLTDDWIVPAASAIPHPLRSAAIAKPDHVVLVADDGEWTATQLVDRVAHEAAKLASRGVAAGMRVVLCGSADSEWVIAFHALGWLGAAVAPLAPEAAPHELARDIATLTPDFVVMKSGAHLQGDFTADNCPALSSLFSSLNDTSGCSSSSSNFGDGGT